MDNRQSITPFWENAGDKKLIYYFFLERRIISTVFSIWSFMNQRILWRAFIVIFYVI